MSNTLTVKLLISSFLMLISKFENQLRIEGKYKDWENTDAILEIGSFENAKKIFKHCKKNNIQIFSQKKNWKKVKYVSDLPKSYKEGSAFLTCNDKMNWGQYD